MAVSGLVSVGETVDAPVVDLSALYSANYGQALRLAYLLAGSRDEAEDIVQDSFIRVFARLRLLRDQSAFPAYLRRTVVSVSLARRRAAARSRTRDDRFGRLARREPGLGETDDGVWKAVQQLPNRQRTAIVLRYWLDLSEAETARSLGCRPGTVKSLVSRALVALRAQVDR